MVYKFEGFDWAELAECWGITVEKGETIDIGFVIGTESFSRTTSNRDAILLEKIKRHIWSNMSYKTYEFKDKSMRDQLVDFLTKLADAEKEQGFNAPVFKAFSKLESDFALAKWVDLSLHKLWV